jgi:hypothetical protein
MLTRTIEPQGSRFVPELVDGVEQVRIPLRRNWFVLLFLCFWICGWTVGGIAAIYQVAANFDWFLLFWLGGWALGWLFAAATIASQLAGSEVIRVVGGNLEISTGVGALRWRRLYRGASIRYLASSDPNPLGWAWTHSQAPFGKRRQGAIKFDYGAQTIYAATAAEEAEGRTIVEWLRPKLPASATDPAA